jgi:hypothetical protein
MVISMPGIPETVRAYLDSLEAARQGALALSEQKAEEAKLIKARQEGFLAAVEILGGKYTTEPAGTNTRGKESVRRRGRRPIREMILRELSFSGEPMTTAQVAKAINYIFQRTENVLERMVQDGEVLRSEDGWIIGNTSMPYINGPVVSGRHGKS